VSSGSCGPHSRLVHLAKAKAPLYPTNPAAERRLVVRSGVFATTMSVLLPGETVDRWKDVERVDGWMDGWSGDQEKSQKADG